MIMIIAQPDMQTYGLLKSQATSPFKHNPLGIKLAQLHPKKKYDTV